MGTVFHWKYRAINAATYKIKNVYNFLDQKICLQNFTFQTLIKNIKF